MPQQLTNSEDLAAQQNGHARNGFHGEKLVISRGQTVNRFRMLWDRRRFLSRLTLLGLAIATVVAFLIPKRYQSTTRLMPPDQSNSGMAMLSAALGGGSRTGGSGSGGGSSIGAIAGDLLGMKTSTDLFIGILQSRTVEDELVEKFNLRNIYRDRYLKDAREDLESKTDISSDRKSGIIKIQVTDHDPRRAAAMAGEYVQELDRLVAQVNTTSAHRERVFLEGRLTGVKSDLEAAEKQFSEFASKNTALDIPTQGKAMIEAAAALKGQLIVAETELQGMRQIYTDNNVRVRGLQARVSELKRQIEQLGGKFDASPVSGNSSTNAANASANNSSGKSTVNSSASLESNSAGNSSTKSSNAQDDQSLYPSIRKLPLLGVNYADLYRNTKVQEAVFETLTQEYELAKVQEAKETPSVKLIDSPDVPEKQSYPHRSWVILGGACLFFLSGTIWIFGNEYWGQIDPKDPGKILVLEVASTLKSHLPSASSNGTSPVQPPQPTPDRMNSDR